MQGDHITYTYHTAGTLAANHTFVFVLPFDAQLVHVSAVASNANDAILDVGTSSDTDAYASNIAVGDSLVPGGCGAPSDFVGGNYPHIAAGTVIEAELDYDGAGGTAAANFTLVLTFTEG